MYLCVDTWAPSRTTCKEGGVGDTEDLRISTEHSLLASKTKGILSFSKASRIRIEFNQDIFFQNPDDTSTFYPVHLEPDNGFRPFKVQDLPYSTTLIFVQHFYHLKLGVWPDRLKIVHWQ